MSKIPFIKMHGCGNDYIYVDTSRYPIANPAKAAILWSDRHKGIGSDGLVLIDRSPVTESDFSMRIFNADGSEGMMCGNACRCIGKYLFERGMTTKTSIRLLTLSGVKKLQLHVDDNNIVESVTVDMGEPVLEDETLYIRSRGMDKGTFVSMGNPHFVIFTDDIDQVGETGRMLEKHPAFPQRCNIEFAQVLTDDKCGAETMMFLSAGRHVYKYVNVDNYMSYVNKDKNFIEKFARFVTNLTASHPINPLRTKAILDPTHKSGRLL